MTMVTVITVELKKKKKKNVRTSFTILKSSGNRVDLKTRGSFICFSFKTNDGENLKTFWG